MWIRACQECGHKNITKPPGAYKNDSWRNLRCRKCKSIALDYGNGGWMIKEENNVVSLVQEFQMTEDENEYEGEGK